MRRFLGVLMCASASVLVVAGLQAVAEHPSWAYGFTTPPPPPGSAPAAPAAGGGRGGGGAAQAGGRQGGGGAAADPTLHSLPGTNLQFTRAQIANRFGPADWYPGDHTAMPEIVARGRMDANIIACSLCHMPNGKGRPENAGVSGLPEEYFIQTMLDFRNGRRSSADPRKGNTNLMVNFAKAMTEEEIRQAAAYFGSMPWTQWIRVVETNTVPQTRIQGGMFLRLDNGMTEPIGNRIIEAPENTERTEVMRDPRSGFVAYAPVGSIARGQTLVTTGGNGRTVACATCHGATLQGMGPVPGLAGRSPSYIVRQLYDMQMGTRKGSWAELMKPVVENLTAEDFVAIAAYTASRPMPPAPGTQTAAR
ncbi:MAG: c-type cytochrome [Acidobacteria bacterium]|nr:c-type cytochrome [Acidobacteriota bacterium]